MASPPEGPNPPELQTVALKVSIHCEGCKKKVKKVLQRVEGVGHIDVDSKQNKVTVTGGANAGTLIKKLGKYGKYAELWPDAKPSPAVKSSGEVKEEGKEKASAAATAAAISPETEQKQPTTEKKQPPAETTAASGEVGASKDSIDAPELSPGEAPANSEKPASAAGSENSKKIAGEERAVSETDESAPRTAAAAAVNPPPPYPFPAYPLPSYTVSYSTARPTISYSLYAPSPAPAYPLSYTTYSGHPPLTNYPPPAPSMYSGYAPEQLYPPANYSADSYYGSVEAPPPAGSYDMFNDENPNACNLM